MVYTPLCGTGDGSVGDVLRAAGYDVQVYPPHNTYDGTFASVPLRLPNPEVPAAASPALPFATERNADLVLATDPDADRLGVYARDAAGSWRYVNGNEIAALLAYYLCLDAEFGPRRSGLLIKTMVTTRTLRRIAERAGCRIVGDLLVGFKYIAHVLDCLEREGRYEDISAVPSDLVMAGEESHGVLLTPAIRDKDAAGGALVLCELVAQLRARGRLLTDYLDAFELECGNHQNAARSIVMKGIRGATLLAEMMRSLREQPPAELGGMPVLRARDLLAPEFGPLRSDTERLSRNFLVYDLEAAQIVVRPSGTEPKAKIYVDVEGSKLPGAAATAPRRLRAIRRRTGRTDRRRVHREGRLSSFPERRAAAGPHRPRSESGLRYGFPRRPHRRGRNPPLPAARRAARLAAPDPGALRIGLRPAGLRGPGRVSSGSHTKY